MQVSTGGNFLNFGYWDNTTKNPVDAQVNLCNMVSSMVHFEEAMHILDVGSGFSEPAFLWKKNHPSVIITCVNINSSQLKSASVQAHIKGINLLNSTAVKIPLSDESCDIVIALESAQHFKPIQDFISETRRILKKDGTSILAIPVLLKPKTNITKIGILKFTWSSEHYDMETIKKNILKAGLKITEIKLVGSNVYVPLADYYIQNRQFLRSEILKRYPSYVEKILFKSMLKMKQAAADHTIEYALIKCTK
jgi:cyclopropane fatty-acyl-phospholipid synthase-like methyltransferase